MVRIKGWLFLLLLFAYSKSYTQTVISGKITNKDQKVVSDVSVTLLNVNDSSIVAFTTSDDSGTYSLSTDNQSAEFLLSIYSFGIQRQIKRISNRTQTVNLTAEQGGIELREVVVKSTKMWGEKDTINYLVSAFSDKKDVVIADVLKKMPGITVSESGQISYKGKPINKFYIENMDMLGGRYNLATNNVAAADVSTVQVLENHQPIKALEKTQFSTDAAINLKIKENRKGIFTATGVACGGYDTAPLYHGELIGMYFGRGFQHLSTYKLDNAGNNIGKDLNSFNSNGGISPMQMTSISIPGGPPIAFNRYFFNNSHATTINNLKKLKNDAELNFNMNFYHDNERRHSYAQTRYTLPSDNSEQVINENVSSRMRTNRLESELRYNLNKTNNYFNNYFNVSSAWNDGVSDVTGSSLVEQNLQNLFFTAKNFTHWVKTREEGKGFEIFSANSAMNQPHNLTVTPGLYPAIFNQSIPYASLSQNVLTRGMASSNRLSLLTAFMIGDIRVSPTLTLDAELKNLRTDFDVQQNGGVFRLLENNDFKNDIRWVNVRSSLGTDFSYQNGDLKINLFLPVAYRYTHVTDALRKEPYTRNKFYFQPSAGFSYGFFGNWQLSGDYDFNVGSPSLSSLYTGYILSNYRSLNRYETRMFDTRNNGGSLSLSYKDILSMFFFGCDVSVSNFQSDAMYGQTMDGVLTVTRLVETPTNGNNLSVNGRISQGFDWKSMVVSANASWGRNNSTQLRQNVLMGYTGQGLNAGGSINLKLAKWLFADYNVGWGRSWGKTDSGVAYSPISTMNNKATVSVQLPFDINIDGTYEHYYNSAVQGNKNFSLADLGLGYIKGRTTYSLDWTNILNTRKFITSSYGALDSYYSEYDIRPMAVMLKVRFRLK